MVGAELVLGVTSIFYVPVNRPSGWVPSTGKAVYLAHAGLGLVVVLGALVFLLRVRRAWRTSRLAGWLGFIGVALAGAGGALTEAGIPGAVLGHGAHVLRPGLGRVCLRGPHLAHLGEKGAAAFGG